MRVQIIIIAMAALLTATSTAAQVTDPRRGLAYLTADCARCHAVTRTDRSHHPDAPPLRSLQARHPNKTVVEIVLEAWSSPHRDMPDFHGDTTRAREILAYLEAIQEP